MRRRDRRGYVPNRWSDGIAESILQSRQVEEQTNAEVRYLTNLIRNRTSVVVKLVNNEEITGWIEYYDKNFIRVTRNSEPNVFVFKDKIKYIFER
jgi:sRNA-binding regulator protein Hfq